MKEILETGSTSIQQHANHPTSMDMSRRRLHLQKFLTHQMMAVLPLPFSFSTFKRRSGKEKGNLSRFLFFPDLAALRIDTMLAFGGRASRSALACRFLARAVCSVLLMSSRWHSSCGRRSVSSNFSVRSGSGIEAHLVVFAS